MANKRIGTLVNEAMNNEATTIEQVAAFQTSLRENLERCRSQEMKSILLFITFLFGWILIRTARIGTIKILEIELQDVGVALLILPIIASYCFYQYQSSSVMAEFIEIALRQLYKKTYPEFTKRGLHELLASSAFRDLENSIANLEAEQNFFRKTADAWVIFVGLTFTLVPQAYYYGSAIASFVIPS